MAAAAGMIAFLVLVLIYTAAAVRIVKEHEQGVVTRFGRFLSVADPGLAIVVPFVDTMRKVDLRELGVVERIGPDTHVGKVRIWGEWWPAKSADGGMIDVGAPIKVLALDGAYVVVRQTGP